MGRSLSVLNKEYIDAVGGRKIARSKGDVNSVKKFNSQIKKLEIERTILIRKSRNNIARVKNTVASRGKPHRPNKAQGNNNLIKQRLTQLTNTIRVHGKGSQQHKNAIINLQKAKGTYKPKQLHLTLPKHQPKHALTKNDHQLKWLNSQINRKDLDVGTRSAYIKQRSVLGGSAQPIRQNAYTDYNEQVSGYNNVYNAIQGSTNFQGLVTYLQSSNDKVSDLQRVATMLGNNYDRDQLAQQQNNNPNAVNPGHEALFQGLKDGNGRGGVCKDIHLFILALGNQAQVPGMKGFTVVSRGQRPGMHLTAMIGGRTILDYGKRLDADNIHDLARVYQNFSVNLQPINYITDAQGNIEGYVRTREGRILHNFITNQRQLENGIQHGKFDIVNLRGHRINFGMLQGKGLRLLSLGGSGRVKKIDYRFSLTQSRFQGNNKANHIEASLHYKKKFLRDLIYEQVYDENLRMIEQKV